MKTKKRDWNELTKDERIELINFANSIGIPPNFVCAMYENYQIEVPSKIKE